MNSLIPLVSIVSICYNHSEYVLESLNSIINQTYGNIELIIFDDCSPDNSVEIIRNWIETNQIECTFIAHEKNRGLCTTMNEAIALCKGKYISLMSADDVMEAEKTEIQVVLLEKSDENVALCVSNFSEIDKKSKVIKERYFPIDFEFPKNIFESMLDNTGVLIHSPTAMVKASVFEKVGPYKEEYIQEDFYMWLKISDRFDILFISKPLVKYRMLETSLGKNKIYREKLLKDGIHVLESFLKEAQEKRKEVIMASLIKSSKYLVDFYLPNKNTTEIVKQIEFQEKYYNKLSQKAKTMILLEAEITEIYMQDTALSKRLIQNPLFKNISPLKKILISYFPVILLKQFRKIRRSA